MKLRTVNLMLVMLFLTTGIVFGQESKECKVLMPSISGTYKGKCKKGLAHGKGEAQGVDHYIGRFIQGWPEGKGTYTWTNGDQYVGEFVKGKREGEGKMTMGSGDEESVLIGIWENDDYKGFKPEKPKVINKYNIDRYNFRHEGYVINRVLIDFMQNGARNTNITDLRLATNSGASTSRGSLVGYENINYPVEIKVMYTTWNKMHTATYRVLFEFRISEPGDWVVTLHN